MHVWLGSEYQACEHNIKYYSLEYMNKLSDSQNMSLFQIAFIERTFDNILNSFNAFRAFIMFYHGVSDIIIKSNTIMLYNVQSEIFF